MCVYMCAGMHDMLHAQIWPKRPDNTEEVNVNLVLGPTVMDGVCCHVYNIDVITEDNHGGG